MGILTNLILLNLRIAFYLTVVGLVITFTPGIPPHNVKFESYTITPALKLEGKLAPNSILNNASTLKIDAEIQAPESISIRGADELFFGDKRGKILKVKNGKVSKVVDLKFPCDKVGHKTCSFPIGNRFDPNGKLVVADAFGGLIRVDVDKKTTETLVARGTIIEGSPVGFPEDLDISKDGVIYWSDATTSSRVENIWNEMFGHATGRLLKYEPSTKKSSVLLNNIHFANGVQLSANEDFVVVSESIRNRIKRVYVKGPKKGQSDIFIDGLPGFPDNIRSNGKGGFYVDLFCSPSLLPDLGEYPLVRKFMTRTVWLLDYITGGLYNQLPNDFTLSIHQFIFAALEPEASISLLTNAFIVELNEKGEIIGSLQSTNGKINGVSQITVGKEFSYFGSPCHKKIWYMKTKDLKGGHQ